LRLFGAQVLERINPKEKNMKKTTSGLITFCLSFLLLCGTALALPMQLTVSGQIGLITSDSAGIIADAGYDVGDLLSFTFGIDLEKSGTFTKYDGSTNEYVFRNPTFFAEYLYGDALVSKDGGFYNRSDDTASYNYGTPNAIYPSGWFETGLSMGSDNECLTIFDIMSRPEDWRTGMHFGFFQTTAYDSQGNSSSLVGGALHITDVTVMPPAPVPEPSTALLLLAGSAFVGFCQKLRKHSA
jgi:hypothetical protein